MNPNIPFSVYGRETMKKILLSISLFLALAGLVVAQQKPQTKGNPAKPAVAVPPQTETATKATGDFIIGVEDVLAIDVWKDKDSSAPQVVVRPDGKITVPLIKDVQAAGLTTKQLEESITEKLLKFMQEPPTVTVIVLKIESQKVSIVGAISKPGAYPLGAPMTVLELIARAGGVTEFAKGGGKSIKILRKKDGRTIDFNLKEVMAGTNLKQNIFLENGDIVMVR
jgi:polysaccharide biosynthesis/export protein